MKWMNIKMIKRFIKTLRYLLFTFIAIFLGVGSHGNFRCNFYSRFTKNTTIGNFSHFNGMLITGNGKVIIGDHFHSGRNCRIISSFHDYDGGDQLPYGNTYVDKDVVIGENVWIGDRVIILGGVTIGEGAIIQAGAVVVSDVPPLCIAGGNPAKVFKKRNVEHYYNLKDNQSFKK